MIGQITPSDAARRAADRIDAVLGESTARYDGPASAALPRAWQECDVLISHLALGATTRLIAGLLSSKRTDPGVVVVDEAGRFCVPLVGGHAGGANELARRLADGLGATAVLTTATDSLGITALDTLGLPYAGDVATVTRALLDGRRVELVREVAWPLPALPENVVERTPAPDAAVDAAARIVVTDAAQVDDDLPSVVLRPPSLVVGMGCNRGTPREALHDLLTATLEGAGLDLRSVGALTTTDLKADEEGLLGLAEALGVPLVTYSAEVLRDQNVPHPSETVAAHVGTPSVAEASVLAHGAELLVPKARTPEATCAVGRLPVVGRLSIVGLGPGSPDLLTPRAHRVLRAAAVVIGYRPYVKQIRGILRPGTRIIALGMGTEERRTSVAIEQAREGRSVALVCGGDPAIYAMASPTLEQGTAGVDVEVVPGVTAELAASAVLGAPLGHDHATISLSDLHTSWETIEQRIEAAGAGDFVVTFYNPRSHRRVQHLPRALEILGRHRAASTPVAVVRNATRPDESVRIATLADFDPAWVDMHSLVVVGSSTTRVLPSGRAGRAMVTPRDYQWMPS